MRSIILPLFVLSCIILMPSCAEQAACCDPAYPICDTADPVNDLPWLKEKVEDLKEIDPKIRNYFFVEQANLNGEAVFIFNNCCPDCTALIPVYNCEGKLICENLPACPDIWDNLEIQAIVWQPADFACNQAND